MSIALVALLGAAGGASAQELEVPPVEPPSVPVPTPSLPDAGDVVDAVTGGGATGGAPTADAVETTTGPVTGPTGRLAERSGAAPGTTGATVPATQATDAPAAAAVGTPSIGAAPSTNAPAAAVAGTPSGSLAAAWAAARDRDRRVAYERRLRRTAARLEGCLYALSGLGRRVLSLRAGTDGEPRSRREVARRLGIDPARVRRSERAGLRALRRADRESGCSAARSPLAGSIAHAGSGSAAPAAAADPSAIASGLFGGPAIATRSGRGRRDTDQRGSETGTGEVAGERAKGPGKTPGSIRAAVGAVRSATDSGPPTILLVLLPLAMVSALGLMALLRSRRPAPTPRPGERPAAPGGWEEGPWTIGREGRLVPTSGEASDSAAPAPAPPEARQPEAATQRTARTRRVSALLSAGLAAAGIRLRGRKR